MTCSTSISTMLDLHTGPSLYPWTTVVALVTGTVFKKSGIQTARSAAKSPCSEYLDWPIFKLAATLFHEMTHRHNLEDDIQDVHNNGYYHNMKFKATVEAHGFHIEKRAKHGWTVTTLASEVKA